MSANQRQDGGAPPAPRGSTPSPQQQPPRFRPGRTWILFALTLLAVNVYLGSRATQPPARVRVPYSPFFLNEVTSGHVKEITSKGTAIQGTFTQKVRYARSKPTTRFRTEIPAFADNNALSHLLQQKGVTVADVAGIEEAEAELVEVVDFLRHPDKYRKLGGRIPHGVLLSGPPGTGKTLLARAVAGEADVPFFSMAASEFVEAIVGVGASRVRDLFTQAKDAAPAIVFIDELDAIGRSRTSGVAGFSGRNDEREQP